MFEPRTARQNCAQGLESEGDIQEKRPQLYVLQIELGLGLRRASSSNSVHLCQSGDARQDSQTQPLPIGIVFHPIRRLGPRPHQRHLTAQDVEELWKFGETPTMAQSGERRVILADVRSEEHTSELQSLRH